MGLSSQEYTITPIGKATTEEEAGSFEHGLSFERVAVMLKHYLASFSELELVFLPIQKFPTHVLLEMFFEPHKVIKYRKIVMFKVVIDGKRYSVSMFMVTSYAPLSGYVFLQLKRGYERKWYFSTYKALTKFVTYLKKANDSGADLRELVDASTLARYIKLPI